VEAGHVTIVLANLLGPGVVGSIPIGHFALVQSNAHPCDEASVKIPIAYVTRDTNMVILLAFDHCGANGRTEESLRAFEGERAEERVIVRVYILGPAALATSSQALSVFLAVWRRGGGPRYIK